MSKDRLYDWPQKTLVCGNSNRTRTSLLFTINLRKQYKIRLEAFLNTVKIYILKLKSSGMMRFHLEDLYLVYLQENVNKKASLRGQRNIWSRWFRVSQHHKSWLSTSLVWWHIEPSMTFSSSYLKLRSRWSERSLSSICCSK